MQATIAEKRLTGKTILVAEDVEMNQLLIRHLLEASGARVVIARNGAEALDQVKSQAFDCILMDVQMPEMDGIEATLQIRRMSDPQLSSIPIIALTANCTAADLEKYQEAGMDDYLSKPVAENNLLEAILHYPEKKQKHKTLITDPLQNKLYDLTMIQNVSGGDGAFIKKMILLFIETVPQNVKELVEATAQSNWDKVSKMAHKLKSTIDSMGIKSLHDQIRAVELNAKNQEQLETIPQMVTDVEKVVCTCIEQLRQSVESN